MSTSTPATEASPTKSQNAIPSKTQITQPPPPQEVRLRRQLYQFNKKITKREPLDPSYKFLLQTNSNVKAPHIHKDKMYKYFGAAFRERVESYMGKYGVENPVMDGRKLKIGRNRENLDVESMRAAFTLRECKKFEQDAFIQAELSAEKARRLRGSLIEEGTRKRSVKAMALGLQERERKKNRRDGKLLASLCQKMLQAEKASLEKKKALASDEKETRAIEEKLVQKEKESKAAKEKQIGEEQRRREIVEAKVRERQRERERIREEEEERIRLEEEREERMLRARMMETPQQALHRLYDPIFQAVWDMEFFDGSNPFRIVIDRENCAVMGAPDYFDYIKTPMNLTYVREKVSQYQYETLQEFFQDMELIISNALVYNSDPNNPYHKAANVMLKKYNKLKSKVLKQCKVNG